MTRTEVLELVQRQRRFEWALARDEHARTAAAMIAGKTHDLMNLVQIVELAALELQDRCDASGKELLADLVRAATDAKSSLFSLLEVARPPRIVTPGPPIGASITRAIAQIRPVVAIDVHLAIAPDTVTELTDAQIEHLLIGLSLDVVEHGGARIELFVRDRVIDGRTWVEIVRGADATHAARPSGSCDHDLRTVEAIAKKVGGELARSDRRGGGAELVVAIPAVPQA